MYNCTCPQVTVLGNQLMEFASLALGLQPGYIWDNVTCRDPLAIVRAFSYPSVPAPDLGPPTPAPPMARTVSRASSGVPLAAAAAAAVPPSAGNPPAVVYGIGRHTDYGLLTMLRTDAPGLEFEHPIHGWAAVPHIPGTFICSVGDVMDRLTGGRWKSRPHRARNLSPDQARWRL